MKTVLMLTCAYNYSGGGHLTRTLAIAEHFLKKKYLVKYYILSNLKRKTIKKFKINFKYKIFLNLLKFYNFIIKNNIKNKYIIFDFSNEKIIKNKKILKKILNFLKKNKSKLTIIDSTQNDSIENKIKPLNCSQLINPYFIKKTKKIFNYKRLIGIKYFVGNNKLKPKSEIKKNDIVITFGMSDAYKQTYHLLKIFLNDPQFIKKNKINVLYTELFNKNYTKKLLAMKNKNINFIKNPNSKKLSYLFNSSKLALIGTGNIKYELLPFNIKKIILSSSRKSDLQSNYFLKHFQKIGFVKSSASNKEILGYVKKYIKDKTVVKNENPYADSINNIYKAIIN
jgi:spore coat polysaccharide biosynthesis predicted glycosyltransferase SpsG